MHTQPLKQTRRKHTKLNYVRTIDLGRGGKHFPILAYLAHAYMKMKTDNFIMNSNINIIQEYLTVWLSDWNTYILKICCWGELPIFFYQWVPIVIPFFYITRMRYKNVKSVFYFNCRQCNYLCKTSKINKLSIKTLNAFCILSKCALKIMVSSITVERIIKCMKMSPNVRFQLL